MHQYIYADVAGLGDSARCSGHFNKTNRLFCAKVGSLKVTWTRIQDGIGHSQFSPAWMLRQSTVSLDVHIRPALACRGVRVVTFNGRQPSPRRAFMPSVVCSRLLVYLSVRPYSRLPMRRGGQLRMASMRPLPVPTLDNANPIEE